MFKPEFLREGDKIAVVSTARKIENREIKDSLSIIKSWGLIPVIGSTIEKAAHQFAGSDQDRTVDFQNMLDDPEIKAIWCARGGYGTVRIIDQIDFSKFMKHPKWIIGYSDITVLHSHIHNLGVATIHAPMPVDFHRGTKTAIDAFKATIFGHSEGYLVKTSKKNILGKASGQLVGGNLSILYSLCGSESAIDTSGKILCIEDLDEYLYHIDRMLQNLKRNGYFDNLAGLIVGGMKKMHDNNIPFGKKSKQIILDIVKTYDFPVAFKFPIGHIEDNRALVFGAEASLEVGTNQVELNYK
ncbi:S66 peptidase family protein [Aquimarina spongiae]|uniref:Muramoyltetrapeptide carboxypeptidase n=1 Tax=Aquimarina spongiae TaxID=570521 RepID=A0A1M6JTS1_9FLAO|nr:LD-carboxypeptidase [Aquimarina spongiae]SHJ50097.1 muramoyltetrapeptide carboxypeptidase [Aquimarina spongiae]